MPIRPEPVWPVPAGSFVLGDSISLAIAPALSRFGFSVTGKVGQSAREEFLREQLSTPAAAAAPAWVIVLGTNNRGDQADIDALVPMAQAINDLRTSKQDVYWVTPHRPASYTGGMSTHDLGAFADELKRMDGHREWLRVLDYAALAHENPQWFEADGQHLHPDADGQSALINMIAGPHPIEVTAPGAITDLTVTAPAPAPSSESPSEVDYEEFVFEN